MTIIYVTRKDIYTKLAGVHVSKIMKAKIPSQI